MLPSREHPECRYLWTGLKTGDVIIKASDAEISEAWDIFRALGSSKKGYRIKIRIIRNKKPKTLQVILDDTCGWRILICAFFQRHIPLSCSPAPAVSVMQSADLREGNHLAHLGRLDWPRRRTVVAK